VVRSSDSFSSRDSQSYFQLFFKFFLNLKQGLSALHTPVGNPVFLFDLYLIKFLKSKLSFLHFIHTCALHTPIDSLLIIDDE